MDKDIPRIPEERHILVNAELVQGITILTELSLLILCSFI